MFSRLLHVHASLITRNILLIYELIVVIELFMFKELFIRFCVFFISIMFCAVISRHILSLTCCIWLSVHLELEHEYDLEDLLKMSNEDVIVRIILHSLILDFYTLFERPKCNVFSWILGYASSASSSGAGLYNNQNTGSYSKYPYSNQYSGYQNNFVGAGASAGTGFPFYAPFAPLPQIPTPYDFNNAFQQYYGSLNNNFAK